MASDTHSAGGGVLIAVGAVAGTAIGLGLGQVVPGFLIGIAAGSAAALVLWLVRR